MPQASRIKGKPFLVRAQRSSNFVRPDGRRIETEKCDLTVSRLSTLEYRCFKCPSVDNGAGNWVTGDPREMLLHAVDHLIGGWTVPAQGLRLLAEEALR